MGILFLNLPSIKCYVQHTHENVEMIIQACLNGARAKDYHPQLPMTSSETAMDGLACVNAGAAELHIHPRSADGRESLLAVDETVRAVRQACPGTMVGVSTGAWIEDDEGLTRSAISAWRELPDYASVNLSEQDAPAVIALLFDIGVGVEAGLTSAADAKRFISLPNSNRVHRILLEIEEQDQDKADNVAGDIMAVLERSNVRRSILLHGFDETVWHFIGKAHQRHWSTRVGLEDGCQLADGRIATDNAALVHAAAQVFGRRS